MTRKIQKAGKKKFAQKKAAKPTATEFVVVGTYKDRQLAWIKKNGVYNYPVREGDDFSDAALRAVRELWLYADVKSTQHAFAVTGYLGKMSKAEFIAKYPSYAKLGASKHDAYYVFRTRPDEYGALHDGQFVVARALDFANGRGRTKKIRQALEQYKRDGEYAPLAAYLPKELSQVPKDQLRVCEPLAQADFFNLIDEVEQKIARFKDRKPNDGILRFIDLFAGIGGIRKGFEQACAERGIKTECVFTSEIKPHAIEVLKQNHPDEYIHGDITKVNAKDIPDFDVLLGGFPCQAFSAAGKRLGFEDTRGTLFFDVARIIKEKQPKGFVLENVEGLVNHDKKDAKAPYGHTLEVILATLDELGYKVSWRVLNASEFGVPQDRKRIYIVGARNTAPNLAAFQRTSTTISSVLEHGLTPAKSRFIDKLLAHYSVDELEGKAIKDKRGGDNNIHSWDFEYKGRVSQKQRQLLNALLRERRKHQWAEQYGIDWMDGMPLTVDMIRTFFDDEHLEEMLDDLAEKRYVVKEHPKRKVKNGKVYIRVQDPTLPLGYNIVAGKMSFEISKVMSPAEIAPTLVAMDMQHLFVVDGDGLRTLTLREGLGMFGYPRDFKFEIAKDLGYDLLGNTVVVPVIRAVSDRLLNTISKQED